MCGEFFFLKKLSDIKDDKDDQEDNVYINVVRLKNVYLKEGS